METIQVTARPWVYLRYRTSMNSDEIGRLMGEAFQKLGQLIGQGAFQPAGPPLAVYHEYSDSGMTMDVGFPTAPGGLAKVAGDLHAGETPSGKAVRVVHKGSYQTLRDTYGQIEKQFEAEGIPMSPMAWEVYVTDPDTTPQDQLETEIYMKVD